MGQRKARTFTVCDLAALREAKGLSLRKLGELMIPPVSAAYISQLENGKAMASVPTLFDLSRIFGSLEIADEYGHRYHLVYKGQVKGSLTDAAAWPE